MSYALSLKGTPKEKELDFGSLIIHLRYNLRWFPLQGAEGVHSSISSNAIISSLYE